MTERLWNGYWISSPCVSAPYFRKSFELERVPGKGVLHLCGLGWHELYINGFRADDRVLAPVVTQFDRHVSYISYDVTALLKPGRNAVTVLLGNGWYNCTTVCTWKFESAPWIDEPKMLCDLECDGQVILSSGADWKTSASPVTFNQLRNGETYDARLEIPGVTASGFDDSRWKTAVLCNPPGGVIVQEELEPCRIHERIEGKASVLNYFSAVYDFGFNLTGWCEIELEAPAGCEVLLEYAEQILPNGNITREELSPYIESGKFQTDCYITKGGPAESWHPRFTYHGFRYCKVQCLDPRVKIKRLTAHFIHNSFKQLGKFSCSNEILNQLQTLTLRSYLGNYTGIPTDCPHREKNGWTGDAQLAMETGLWNFDCRKAALHFNRILADTQRPSGQLPGIAPTGGWGYNWGSGPGWDIYLFEAPYQIYRFTGDDQPLKEFLPEMKKYISYCRSCSHDHLVQFGLGDWCCCDAWKMTPAELTSSAYYFYAAKILSVIAPEYSELAEAIRKAVNAKYYRGNGIYADGERTALACALYFGIADEDQVPAVVQQLVQAVRRKEHRAGFGIFGAKYIPRVLAEHGFIDDAVKLLTQPEFPGWGYWVKNGATTLHENWNSAGSQNHIMFGDVSAFMYEYLAGFKPGMKLIAPQFAAEVDSVNAAWGNISLEWGRKDQSVKLKVHVGEGILHPVLRLPGMKDIILPDGMTQMTVPLP